MLSLGLTGCGAGLSTSPDAAGAGAGCHAGDPLAGVYHPNRLSVVRPCATVTGTVACVRSEPDGDTHIRLRVDDQYQDLLTAGNSAQRCAREGDSGPHLVVEIVPQHCGGVQQRDAGDNCADGGGFTSPAMPAVGSHVAITGPLVTDLSPGHGEGAGSGWAEIHPAEVIAGS